nr:glutaredoxin [uncultured Piscinibacter sp.]
MFALEWCEFCWAVRKLFDRLGIAYHAVDLDSVPYQAQDMGIRVRAELLRRTGAPSIPQIWIHGTAIGGATDLFDAMRSGRAQALLAEAGIACDAGVGVDPYAFLPRWLHPRKVA